MILPILGGLIIRAAVGYAIKRGAQYAIKRAAQRALQQRIRDATRQAGRRLAQRDARRTARCRNCQKLKFPCDLLRRGNPLSTGSYRGGSYGGTRRPGIESHHMPADSAYPATHVLGSARRPAIQMDPADHSQTASHGHQGAAGQAYRNVQRNLIARGRAEAAFAMDVADIKTKFGSKYDEAIAEATAYLACLKKNGQL